MKSRKYDKRIEVYQLTNVPDGFGGNTVSKVKVGESWCNLKTLSFARVTEFGLNENQVSIEVNLRDRKDLNYKKKDTTLVYKSVEFNIITVEPKDFEGVEIRIIASSNNYTDGN